MLTFARHITITLFSLVLTSCAVSTHTIIHTPTSSAHCKALFQSVDQMVAESGVRDAEAPTLPSFPYLRINRFYTSFQPQLHRDDAYQFWIRQLAQLDTQARAIEIHNLPADKQSQLGKDILPSLQQCRNTLIQQESIPLKKTIIEQAVVPDGYSFWKRILGIYPISSLFVSAGVHRWHQEVQASYAQPLEQLPIQGNLKRWSSSNGRALSTTEIQNILATSQDTLGIPRPNTHQLDQLFHTFAPIWEVDTVDSNDAIGSPSRASGHLTIDTQRPVEYRKVSYTRYQQQTLLQLNYVIWFPKRASGDIYAGKIDGITWRVTIGSDGSIWMYDSIHNCGCYHKYYPNPIFRLRSDLPSMYVEPPLVPQSLPDASPVVIRVAHLTHYIDRIRHASKMPAFLPLRPKDYDSLRSLPTATRFQSMFDKEGLVGESQRPERYILWMMGVPSPGAMRQWGTHITAFVGSGHFDDPHLMESLFEKVK